MALLIFLVLVIGGAYLALPGIIGAVARDRLATAGFAPVSLDVAGVGLEEVRIVDLRLGPGPGLTVSKVVLRYRLSDLLEGVIDGITIVSPRLSGRLDSVGLSIPLLDHLASGEGGQEVPRLPS